MIDAQTRVWNPPAARIKSNVPLLAHDVNLINASFQGVLHPGNEPGLRQVATAIKAATPVFVDSLQEVSLVLFSADKSAQRRRELRLAALL